MDSLSNESDGGGSGEDRLQLPREETRMWSVEFDGLENILSRLPIFNVLRCRSVCKAWNTIISSWNFKRLWSKVQSQWNSWVVMVDWPLGLSATSFIFYNVYSHEWRLKLISFGEILDQQFAFDGYLLATSSTARGLIFFLPDYFLPARCERNILVLNPLVDSYQLISLPRLSNARHVNLGVALKMTVAYAQDDSEMEGAQMYKILFVCSHGDDIWSCQMYNPLDELWAVVPWPPSSARFSRYYSAEDCFWDLFAVQQLSTLYSSCPNRVKRNFHFALIVYSGAAPDDIKGCVDVMSFDTEKHTFFRLCVPWSWDNSTYPNFKLGVIQRNDILINPFLEVTADFECLGIKINTLEVRYENSEQYRDDGVWHTKAIMPHELFESLHSGLNRRCHSDLGRPYDCFTRMKCLTDDRTDQVLFLSNNTSYIHIVAYRFSPPSPDQEWASLRYPVDDDNELNNLLRSPSISTGLGMLNFQFRL